MAALANPRRHLHRILVTPDQVNNLNIKDLSARRGQPLPPVESVARDLIDRLLPQGAVHQGIAVRGEPLPYLDLTELLEGLDPSAPAAIAILDQVSDPHNVGAVLRSAAALGLAAVIVTERNSAPESGVLAKSASGALDLLPLIRVANLARALKDIKDKGFWCVGLAADAREEISKAKLPERIAFLLGSEGEGLRRLTREACDLTVRLPTGGPVDQLNVSNAAAIAFYDWRRRFA